MRRSRLDGRRGKEDSGVFEQIGRFAVLDLLSIGAVETRAYMQGGDQLVQTGARLPTSAFEEVRSKHFPIVRLSLYI